MVGQSINQGLCVRVVLDLQLLTAACNALRMEPIGFISPSVSFISTHLSSPRRTLPSNSGMPGKVHLVRHAEGLHNLYDDTSIPDAPLSQRGFDFAEDLGKRFVKANSNAVGLLISSPLRRAIETSFTAFNRVLRSDLYLLEPGGGVIDGVEMWLDANLQEIDDVPANTGSVSDELRRYFPGLVGQIHDMGPDWNDKATLPTVAQRKAQILDRMQQVLRDLGASGTREKEKKDVVVVTHAGVIDLLAPGVSVEVAQWKTFSLIRGNSGELKLKLG